MEEEEDGIPYSNWHEKSLVALPEKFSVFTKFLEWYFSIHSVKILAPRGLITIRYWSLSNCTSLSLILSSPSQSRKLLPSEVIVLVVCCTHSTLPISMSLYLFFPWLYGLTENQLTFVYFIRKMFRRTKSGPLHGVHFSLIPP